MIYSRAMDIEQRYFLPAYWNKRFCKPLSQCIPRKGDVYLYDRHDRHLRGLEFDQFVDADHWQLIQQGFASIVIDFSDDFCNLEDLQLIAKTLKDRGISGERVYMLVMDPLWTRFVKGVFDKYDLKINIAELPWLLYQAVRKFPSELYRDPEQSTRFSLLSRNYRPWRLELLLNLHTRGFDLDNTDNILYSFHRYDPYRNISYSHEDIRKDAYQLGFNVRTQGLNRWIKGIPYEIGSNSNKFFQGTYDAIINSDIHILIESHWDPFQTKDIRLNEAKDLMPNEWAPSFLTEKFYKAILCGRPFIVVSTPWFLKDIQSLGYKTFPQLIEEDYDNQLDDSKRNRVIANEIIRLSRMPKPMLDQLVANTTAITNRNRYKLMAYHDSPVITDEFLFLRNYMVKDQFPAGTWDQEFVKS